MDYSTRALDKPSKKKKRSPSRRPLPQLPPGHPLRPLPHEPLRSGQPAGPAGVLSALRRNRTAMAAVLLLAVVAVCAIVAPLLIPGNATQIDFSRAVRSPSLAHPFGTDDLGRDLFVRVMQGGRISLAVGALAMALALLVGVIGGGIAGYRGGLADSIIMRLADLTLSIPLFLLILLASSIMTPGIVMLCILISCTQWMEVSRMVRSIVMTTKENEFVEAARALGVPGRRILFHHVLRHTSGPVLASATIVFAQTIMLESAVSFLGYGVQPPNESWGGMMQGAAHYMASAPWMAVFPGLMIFIAVLCCYTIGDFFRSTLTSRIA